MSETFFPLTDLFRRRLQTSLVVATLALSVASTLSLLLFCDRIGFGIFSSENILTEGLIIIFSQFATFIGIMIFAVGAVMAAFLAFLMMAQRTRDFGLMKAAGCPNGLVAGYFMTELLIVNTVSCTLGALLGVLIDYAVSRSGVFQSAQKLPNYWLALLVFAVFFVLTLIFGVRPVVNAARMAPVKALSPVRYLGLNPPKKFIPFSGYGLTWRMAYRSLVRRQSATVRIIILLTITFILTTVVVAGGIIASGTTVSWVEKTFDRNTIMIAHTDIASQYTLLLSEFSAGARQLENSSYLDDKFAVSDDIIQLLSNFPGVSKVDARLILIERVRETSNFTIDPETLETFAVGDHREIDSLIVGAEPQRINVESIQGRTISLGGSPEALIGDSIGPAIFSPKPSKGIKFSNPLVQGVSIRNAVFRIVGVCVDPLNNGYVIYVPIQELKNITNTPYPNIVFAEVEQSVDLAAKTAEIRSRLIGINPNLEVIQMADVAEKNVSFLRSAWSTVMLLPLFTLVSAAFCLIGYMMIAAEEQKQEFAVMRAIGGKPTLVIGILAFQSATVLFSGFGMGISLGVIATISILMSNPLVTSGTIIEIAGWLFSAVVGVFILTLLPAFRIAKSSILKSMT